MALWNNKQKPDELWWTNIQSASLFIHQAATAIQNRQSVLLILPTHAPWPQTMRNILEEQLQEKMADRSIEHVEEEVQEPGQFLLKKFCKKEKRHTYRPVISEARFLGESREIVLNQQIVWVQAGPKTNDWISFITEYNKYAKNQGALFLLEVKPPFSRSYSGLHSVDCKSHHSGFDVLMFASLLAQDLSCPAWKKEYAAHLSAELCWDQIEAIPICLQDIENFLQNPQTFLQNAGFLSPRDAEKQIKKLRQKIWTAQIKTIFPVLETFRMNLIEKYSSSLQDLLPIDHGYTKIQVPEEVELGTISWLTHTDWSDQPGMRMLFLQQAEYNRLQICTLVRNLLAHQRVVPPELAEYVLGGNTQFINIDSYRDTR